MYGSQQWYMAIGGHQVGPVTQEEIIQNLRNGSTDSDTLVFTSGMSNWQKIKDVPAFAPFIGTGASANVPPPPTAPGRRAHDIDFVIHGNEMQFVEVELDPGEAAIAEAGVMMYMTQGIELETIFGDGSQQQSGGVLDALWGAGKRILTGESLFMTVFTNKGVGKQRVAFGAPYPGKIIAMDLKSLGGSLICQKDSFLCAARGVASCRSSKATGSVSCTPAAPSTTSIWRRANRCASIPAVWWRSSQVSRMTSSSWARSRPRCSVGKASSSRACAGRAASGYSRCP
jgi:hypothetical protein